jgi:histone H3/H4
MTPQQIAKDLVNKLHNNIQNELHGGYDDPDYLRGYERALCDVELEVKAAVEEYTAELVSTLEILKTLGRKTIKIDDVFSLINHKN